MSCRMLAMVSLSGVFLAALRRDQCPSGSLPSSKGWNPDVNDSVPAPAEKNRIGFSPAGCRRRPAAKVGMSGALDPKGARTLLSRPVFNRKGLGHLSEDLSCD